MITVIPGRQARIFGSLMMAAGLLSAGAAAWSLMIDDATALWGRLVLAAIVGLVGALFWVGGRMLAQRRGGVSAVPGTLLLFGDSAGDVVSVPADQIRAVCTLPLRERWGDEAVERWVVEAVFDDAPRVLLGESQDEHGLKQVAHQAAAAAQISPPVSDVPRLPRPTAPQGAPPRGVQLGSQDIVVSVGSSGQLANTLLVSGLAMAVIGAVLLLDLANNHVFGFLFGPTLVALGLLLAAIPITKMRLSESIRFQPGRLDHVYKAFGRQFGHRSLALVPGSYVRVRQRGLLGASLEVVSDGRIHHLAGGVHRRSRLDAAGLFWLGQLLRARIAVATEGLPEPIPSAASDGADEPPDSVPSVPPSAP